MIFKYGTGAGKTFGWFCEIIFWINKNSYKNAPLTSTYRAKKCGKVKMCPLPDKSFLLITFSLCFSTF
jgi:hypothetical protein